MYKQFFGQSKLKYMISSKNIRKIDCKSILKKTFLERTVLQWLELIGFFIIFYIFVGGFFITHIMIYLQIISKYTLPQNAGNYLGYTNYPNNQLLLASYPQKIAVNLKELSEDGVKTNYSCVNTNKPQNSSSIYTNSIEVYVNKVVDWKPEIINSTYKGRNVLEMNCSLIDNQYNITIKQCSNGLPLNLNNTKGRSYPYSNNINFVRPKMTVLLDFHYFNSNGLTSYRIHTSLQCIIEACREVANYHCPPALTIPIIITNK